MLDKQALRKQMLESRRAMALAEVRDKSMAIVKRLHSLEAFQQATRVLTYVASKDNEVDTRPLIESLLPEGKDVLVPIAEPGGHMTWSRLDALSELRPARFGILEPAPEFKRPTSPTAGDVVLVPGVAFAPDGYRIGYGGGYFDRFMAGFPGTKIGLAYDLQIVEKPPVEVHDVPVDMVVTEAKVYRC